MSLVLQALRTVERGEVFCLPPDGDGPIFYFRNRDPYELTNAPIGSEHQNLNRTFAELESSGRIRAVGWRGADGSLQLELTASGRNWLAEA